MQKSIFQLPNNNIGISYLLFQQLENPVTIHNAEHFLSIHHTVQFIATMGWAEHTSDWDLGAIIKTKDGTIHEIEQGYGDCMVLYYANGIDHIFKPNEDVFSLLLQNKGDLFIEFLPFSENGYEDNEEDHMIKININTITEFNLFD